MNNNAKPKERPNNTIKIHVTAAVTCIFMVLFGLSLGFALLKVQGE